MKTLKELADLGAAAARFELNQQGVVPMLYVHSGDTKDEPARQAFAQAVRDAVLADLVTKPDSSPTFEAHGFTWFKHKLGDPMPCDGETKVCVIYEPDELFSGGFIPARCFGWTNPDGYTPIIGWRYADKPTTKTIPLDINDIRATDEFKSKWSHIIETADYWCDDEVSLAWSGDAPTYADLAASYLRRQHGSTEWKPCTKEVVG